MFGADISVYHLFFKALLPATLGNIVGGGIFVGGVYWYVFEEMASGIEIFSRIRHGWEKHHPHIASHHRHPRNDNTRNNGGSDDGGDNGHIVFVDNDDKDSL